MKVLIAIIAVAGLSWIILNIWRAEDDRWKKVFWPALVLKLLAGICLGLVYTYYYTVGDTFIFFQDGVKLTSLARNDFGQYINFLWSGDEAYSIWSRLNSQQPRALFLAKMVSLVNLITADNYWITSLYFSFASFFCSWYLVKTISNYFPTIRIPAIIAFLFFPSIVFWSSGITKESLGMASLFFLSSIFIKGWCRDKISIIEWVMVFLTFWILWNLKYYYAAVFVPVTVTSLTMRLIVSPLLKPKRAIYEITIWFILFLVPLILISFSKPNFYPEHFLDVIVENYNAFYLISLNPEKLIHYHNLETNGLSVIANIPLALASGLFRPFLWEAENIFQFVIAGENTVLLFLFLAMIPAWKNIGWSPYGLLLVALMVYVFLLCVFLSLSTPNFGTLSRYRVGFLPFFILLLTCKNTLVDRFTEFVQSSFPSLVR